MDTITPKYQTYLRQILTNRFDEGEIRTLCFDLDVDYDTLSGGAKADKARELISYLNRRDRIADLVEVGKRLRPDIPWKSPTAVSGSQITQYLASLRQRFEYLDLGGIAPRVQNRTVKLRMDDVFIPVQARPELESDDEWPGWPDDSESEEIALRMLARRDLGSATLLEIADLVQHQRVVILGDPGCGKSTLLRHIAYAIACGTAESVGQAVLERLPIFVRIVQFSQAQAENSTLALDTYIGETCEPKWATLFQHALDAGKALVLLDGLDEVVDAHQRRGIAEAIQRLVADYPGNAFIVASRIVGYQAARLSGDFAHYTIQPLPPERITEFVEKWYAAIEREAGEIELSEEAQERAKELSRTIQQRPGIHRLAENPLLLTIVALVNWRGRKLPNQRVELYAHAAETLIESWPYRRQGAELDTERVIRLLSPVAYRIFATRSSGDIAEDDLLPIVTDAICRVDGVDERMAKVYATEFLEQISERSGIFRERGYDERGRRVFGFLHLTFAEYFTARYLAGLWEGMGDADERRALLRKYAHVPRWREVVLLMAGDVGLRDNDHAERATLLLRDILTLGSDYEGDLHRDLLLACEYLADDLHVQHQAAHYVLDELLKLVPEPGVNEVIQSILHSMRETAYGPLVLEGLLTRLENENKWAKLNTALTLGALDDTRAAAILLSLLKDEEKEIRWNAVSALGRLGNAQVEPLLALLEDEESQIRARAAWALGCIGDERAVKPLRTRLRDQDRWVQVRAAKALAALGDVHKIEALLVWIGSEDEKKQADAVRTKMWGDTKDVEISLGQPNSEVLIAQLEDEVENVRWIAAETLGILNDARAVKPLIERLGDEAMSVRWASTWALGEIGDTQAVEPLLVRLEKDAYNRVRVNAAWSLGLLGDIRAVDPLIAQLEDEHIELRRGAAWALGKLGDTCAVKPLLTRLKDNSRRVRSMAYQSLITILNRNAPSPQIDEMVKPQAMPGPWDS